MSRKPATATAFLSALNLPEAQAEETTPRAPVSPPAPAPDTVPDRQGRARKGTGSREGLKHIGGYLRDEEAERFARLKVRTKLGNDELLARAIDELWRIEGAKRKWED